MLFGLLEKLFRNFEAILLCFLHDHHQILSLFLEPNFYFIFESNIALLYIAAFLFYVSHDHNSTCATLPFFRTTPRMLHICCLDFLKKFSKIFKALYGILLELAQSQILSQAKTVYVKVICHAFQVSEIFF